MGNIPNDLNLLNNAASGGDTAGGGFAFQDAVFMRLLPAWLQDDGFSSCIRESLDDIEAKFFVPGIGFQKERIQVKHEVLRPQKFATLVDNFHTSYEAHPQSYQWCTIACIDVSGELEPVIHGLRRLRDPYPFYADDSAVLQQSFDAFAQRVKDMGGTETLAAFMFHHLHVHRLSRDLEASVQNIFQGEIAERFGITDYRALTEIFRRTKDLILSRRNQPITRRALDAILAAEQVTQSVRLVTASSLDELEASPHLVLDCREFWGGEQHAYPVSDDWNTRLVAPLQATKDWLISERAIYRVELTGHRRYSASLAIGHVFSSVSGFTVVMNFRGDWWATDAHADDSTPAYVFEPRLVVQPSYRLVVAISIDPQAIAHDVATYINQTGTSQPSTLYLQGTGAIHSPQHCKRAVAQIKQAIREALRATGAQEIDLFLAGVPAPLALFLGHHLNGLAPIQCYEWTGGANYVPTCRLI